MKPKKSNKQKDILFVLISSFVVVAAWISFNLYHIWVTSTISEHIQYQLTPIDPTFDQTTIQELKTRENIAPLFEAQIAASQPAALTPLGESTITVTPSETTPTPSQVISPATSQISPTAPTSEPIDRQGQ